MVLVAHGQLPYQTPDGLKDRIERFPVSRQDHPGGKSPRPLVAERVEGHLGDVAGVGLAAARALDNLSDAHRDSFGDRPRELRLQAGGRAEMMQQIGVSPADRCGHRLQRDRLWPPLEQDGARSLQSGKPAFLGAQALATY